MENKKKNKARTVALIIVFGAFCVNMIRTNGFNETRSVDMVQLFAGGAIFGLLVASIAASVTARKEMK